MLSRKADRRKARRQDSAGRRSFKRYVLESEEVVSIELSDQIRATADVLDLSLSGAYLLLATQVVPQSGQSIAISFSGLGFEGPELIRATVKYVNSSVLCGMQMYGLGVQFVEDLSDALIVEELGNVIAFGGKSLRIKA